MHKAHKEANKRINRKRTPPIYEAFVALSRGMRPRLPRKARKNGFHFNVFLSMLLRLVLWVRLVLRLVMVILDFTH